MRNTWDLDIVWVREMGLEVYAQAILSSLAILAVAVDAENDFGEETSVQKGKIALVYLRNKQVSKNCVNRSVFKPVSFFFLILKFFSSNWFFLISYLTYSLSKKPYQQPNDESADSVIAGIVEKILRESEIRGVVINSRILNVFKKKISLLHSAFKKASKSGEEYKEAYWFMEGKNLLLQYFLSWAWKQLIGWGKSTASWAEKESWTGFSRRAGKAIKNWAGAWRCY